MSRELRNVLIFAHECAPYNRPESTVGAQRPAQFAKYLPEFGWRAVVLCCDCNTRGAAVLSDLPSIAQEARQALIESDPQASLVIPTPSLRCDGLLDRVWRLTASRRGGANSVARKVFTVAKFLTGDYSQNWQPAARAAACAIAKEIRIDACMGEHGPDAGLYLARWFSESFGAPWVVDFRDPILQPFSPLGRRLYKPMARRLMRTASAAVNVNRVWAELDHEMFSIQSWSIPNGFDPDEFEGDLAPDGAQQFTIAYIGNIIPQQRIESFIEGLALLRRVDEESFRSIRFLYRGLANERVGRVVTAAGVGDVADIGERTERKAAIELIRGADLLLLLSIAEPDEQDIYYSRGIYPAKAFEYFGARRPIICVPGDSGLLDELIERTGTGVSLRSPREVADYLSQAVREWRSERRLPYRSRQAEVCRYTRRNLTAQLADLLNLIS